MPLTDNDISLVDITDALSSYNNDINVRKNRLILRGITFLLILSDNKKQGEISILCITQISSSRIYLHCCWLNYLFNLWRI